MIDVSGKKEIYREATAIGRIRLKAKTIRLIGAKKVRKGDVIEIARVASVLAAKKTSELIPLCHPLPLSSVKTTVEIADETHIAVETTVKALARTGVEMEALTAVSAALLTVWDLTKQHEKNSGGQYPTTLISNIRVLSKVKDV
jgi:cyclic pyranopterin phosphate synthase